MPGRAAPGLQPTPAWPRIILWLSLLFLLSACQLSGSATRPAAPAAPSPLPSIQPTFGQTVIAGQEPAAPRPTVAPTWTAAATAAPTLAPTASPTPGCQEAGQVIQGRFASALAPPDLAYRIYLPPCYGQDGRFYPVLYMLPGNVHDDSIWDQLGLDEAAEAEIQAGQLPPHLIVMPEGGAIANQTSGGAYSYESVIVDELLPYVEANYCAWPAAAGRAIGGLSRGGYWSLEIAFRQPALFASVGGHSAALVDTYAGPALDPTYTALSADLSSLRIYLDAGQSDWYLGQLSALHDNLLAAGKEHAWVIQEGRHDQAYWAAHVADYLAWYAEPWPLQRDQLPRCGISPAS
jgi:enterochelin esterase-like enzyme